jgi:protein FAM50
LQTVTTVSKHDYRNVGIMTDIKRVGDSGVFTVEGSVAGSRASRLTKQRDLQKAEYEAAKNKIKEQNAAGVGRIDDKFNAATDSLEQEFRRRTVGLVTADDFRKAKEETVEVKSVNEKIMLERQAEATERRKAERAMKRKKSASSLSFSVDDDADNSESAEPQENSAILVKKTKKDPTVMTSFLPDKDRDMVQRQERERLQKEWLGQQTAIKNEVSFQFFTDISVSVILHKWI